MIPDALEIALLIPADESVGTELVRIFKSMEFLIRHDFRIETGALRHVPGISLQERLAGKAVPWSIVDHGVVLLRAILDVVDQSLVTESLLPVDFVGFDGREAVEVENLLAVVTDSVKKAGLLLSDVYGNVVGKAGIPL